jgi:hypothetical protein
VIAGDIPPVVISTQSAEAAAGGIASAARETINALSSVSLRSLRSMITERYPDVEVPLGEIDQRAALYREESARRVRAAVTGALRKPGKREVIREIDARIQDAFRAGDKRKLRALEAAREKASSSPGPRERAVRVAIERERRYARAHLSAQAARAFGLAEQARLERDSPDGAFWVLGEAKEHTVDCIALAGRAYPHAVLRRLSPPIHVGCKCRLLSMAEAEAQGLWDGGPVPSVPEAVGYAKRAMALHESDAEAILLLHELHARGGSLLDNRESGGLSEFDAEAPERLREALLALKTDDFLKTPDGAVVRRLEEGRFRVRRDGRVKVWESAAEAARDVLDRSARSRKPGSAGGEQVFEDYAAYVREQLDFKERLHPRDHEGRFRDTVDKLGFSLDVTPGVTPEPLAEAGFELLHPRGSGGKFKDKVSALGFSVVPDPKVKGDPPGAGGFRPEKPKPDAVKPPRGRSKPLDREGAATLVPSTWLSSDGKIFDGKSMLTIPAGLRPHPTKKPTENLVVLVPEEGHHPNWEEVHVTPRSVKRVPKKDLEDANSAMKFERVWGLATKIPDLDDALVRDVRSDDDALAVGIMRVTGARPGGVGTQGKTETHGVTTLRAKHVKIEGDSVSLDFTGKSGKRNRFRIADPAIADALRGRVEGKGPDDALLATSRDRANAYLKRAVGADYKVKDLRTALASATARQLLNDADPPRTDAEKRALRKRVIAAVAEHLNNTPAIAERSYIHPRVWDDLDLPATAS